MSKNFSQAIKNTSKILDLWIPEKIKFDNTPGVSVGIIYKGKLVYKKSFGYADEANKTLATSKTGYRIASISKTFTSVSILQLAEQKKLKLDDKVEKYLPWFKSERGGLKTSQITIRQLLSHSAGVFRDGQSPHWEDDNFPNLEMLKKSISKETLVLEPRKQFKYSNFGFAVLGQIIEKVSGMTYAEYTTLNIIRKLNMENTASDFEVRFENNLANGYSRTIPDQKRKVFRPSKTNAYAPATGFLSNVSDLAKYVSALNFHGHNLLSRKSMKEATKKYRETTKDKEWYGLGFGIYQISKRKVVGHGGGFPGFITRIGLDMKNDIGVIVLTNAIDGMAGIIHDGIFETIYKLIDDEHYSKKTKRIKLSDYEASYRSRFRDAVIVGINNILVRFDPRAKSPLEEETILIPKDKDKFTIEVKSNFNSPGELAKFTRSKGGKIKALIWGATPYKKIK